MRMTNLREFIKTALLINLCILTFINTWHDKNLCVTNLCNWRLTHIIRINKSRAVICHYTVPKISWRKISRVALKTTKFMKVFSLESFLVKTQNNKQIHVYFNYTFIIAITYVRNYF